MMFNARLRRPFNIPRKVLVQHRPHSRYASQECLCDLELLYSASSVSAQHFGHFGVQGPAPIGFGSTTYWILDAPREVSDHIG